MALRTSDISHRTAVPDNRRWIILCAGVELPFADAWLGIRIGEAYVPGCYIFKHGLPDILTMR